MTLAEYFEKRFRRQHCGLLDVDGTLLVEDRQIAVVTAWETPGRVVDHASSLVEAVEDGWWYSAPLPRGRIFTGFFTDAERVAPCRRLNSESLAELVDRTEHTRARVQGLKMATLPSVVSAKKPTPARIRWRALAFAVGDAAMAFDPLSAHGLTLAVKTACDAIEAIATHGTGGRKSFPLYYSKLEDVWHHYAARRAAYYEAEGRWPAAPYWRRRRF